MSTVGRNDSCPCGSGKKYKKCCMGKDRDSVLSNPSPGAPSVPSMESQRHHELVGRLMAFAAGTNHSAEYKEALQEFFMRDDYNDWETEYGQQIFHAWLLFYREDHKGETLAQRYLAKQRKSLSPEERRILEGMRDEPFRLVEVLKVHLDEGLTVKDLHSEETFEVKERAATHQLTRWDLLLTRLRRFSAHNEFDMVVPVNRSMRAWMLEAAQWLLDKQRKSDPRTDIVDVMTDDLPYVFDALVEGQRQAMRPPKIKTSDGEELIFCTARYRLEDESAARKALARHRSFEPVEEEDAFRWHSGYRKQTLHGMPGYVTFGVVRFEKGHLILETNSRQRLKKGKVLLEKNVGRFVKHLADSLQDAGQAMAESRPQKGPIETSIPPEVEKQIIAQAMEQYYLDQWPKTPVPALDGMTPIQAATSKAMRPRLIELLKDFEYGMEKNPAMVFDLGRLWKKLGLKRE